MTNEKGKLYLVATPIGNLSDMTFRAVETLKEVDLIAAEDTRNTIRLLNHFDIHTEMTSYHEHNKIEKADYLLNRLENGENIALVTDAGTPGISDPGEELVKMCYERGLEVYSVPGAVAFVNAAVSSGQPTRRIAFEAFLPKDKKERERVLKEMAAETRTIVLYEAPHKLKKTIEELYKVLGDRELTICRELTKLHEEKAKTTLGAAVEYYKDNDPRGEYVLVIHGKTKEECETEAREKWENLSVEEHVKMYEDKGMSRKDAMKEAAKDRGVRKSDIYRELNVD